MTFLQAYLPSNHIKNKNFAKKVAVGTTKKGESVDLVELSLENGSRAVFLSYGARIVSFCGADGQNVVLSLDSIQAYEEDKCYLGASIGRVCNRIKGGELIIGQKTFQLAQNEGKNCLHGGHVGFDKHIWQIEELSEGENKTYVVFSTFSPDGDQGFPSCVQAKVKYALERNEQLQRTELYITYDTINVGHVPTVTNMTNHVYWNLSGKQLEGETIWSHSLKLASSAYLETDANLIPTGNIKQIPPQSYLDFSEQKILGGPPKEEQGNRNGYDHYFVIKHSQDEYQATVKHQTSGKTLQLWTDQPGLQFYTGLSRIMFGTQWLYRCNTS
eukprot:jgi/Galph1/4040/GphlegSOOS_G2701.1